MPMEGRGVDGVDDAVPVRGRGGGQYVPHVLQRTRSPVQQELHALDDSAKIAGVCLSVSLLASLPPSLPPSLQPSVARAGR